MRGGNEYLCGVVRSLDCDPEDDTTFVFTSGEHNIEMT